MHIYIYNEIKNNFGYYQYMHTSVSILNLKITVAYLVQMQK